MLHDTDDHGKSQTGGYEPPRISTLGSLQELTLSFNKKGPSADVFSNLVPIIGSLNPAR